MPIAAFAPAIIGGVSSLGTALIGRNASKNAATQQVDAQTRIRQLVDEALGRASGEISSGTGDANRVISDSVQAQLDMFRPYMEAGPNALRTVQDLVREGGDLDQQFKFTREDLDNDEGFQFTMEQGRKAIEDAAALRGNLFSTGTVKNLIDYRMGSGAKYFDEAHDRAAKAFTLNRDSALQRTRSLQDLVQLGFGGATAAGGATRDGAARMSSNIFDRGRMLADLDMAGTRIKAGVEDNIGDARASGTIGSARSLGAGITGATDAVTKSISDWLATRKAKGGGTVKSTVGGGIYDGSDYLGE